jgi:hypothetical protein
MRSRYQFPSPATKSYSDAKKGTKEWVEARSRSLQIQADNLSENNIRLIRQTLEEIREVDGWNVWPEPPARTPSGYLKLVLGVGAHEFLNALEALGFNMERNLLSWLEQEDREAGAENVRPGGDKRSENIIKRVTLNAHSGDLPGFQRRLQRRANGGDQEAIELLARIDAGEISTNRAAQLAGMRKEYLRIPKDDPAAAARRIREKLGEEFARILKDSL